MKILTNNNNAVFVYGNEIEIGRWENDPTMDTYRIKTDEGFLYAVIADFGLHEVESMPADFEANKYCYTEAEGFYINPEWIEPNPYGIDDTTYNNIIDDYTSSITTEVANSGY